jgi:hypothetical protein
MRVAPRSPQVQCQRTTMPRVVLSMASIPEAGTRTVRPWRGQWARSMWPPEVGVVVGVGTSLGRGLAGDVWQK